MKKVLIIVDMQHDFVRGSLGTPEAVEIIPRVCGKMRTAIENGMELCFTLDTHREDYLNTQEGKNLPVVHCMEGTDGWKLEKELEELLFSTENLISPQEFYEGGTENIKVFRKEIFGSVSLAEYIKELYQKDDNLEVELVGLCTDICVVSNAILLKSFLPELKIVVDASCCAGVTVESHRMALETLKMCQVSVEN